MNKRDLVAATTRDFSRLSYEAQQFVLDNLAAILEETESGKIRSDLYGSAANA